MALENVKSPHPKWLMLLDYDDGKLGRYGVHGVPVDGAAMSIAPTSSYCGALWIECSKKAVDLSDLGWET